MRRWANVKTTYLSLLKHLMGKYFHLGNKDSQASDSPIRVLVFALRGGSNIAAFAHFHF